MLKQVTGMAQNISELVFLYCRKQRHIITQIKAVSEYIFSRNFVARNVTENTTCLTVKHFEDSTFYDINK